MNRVIKSDTQRLSEWLTEHSKTSPDGLVIVLDLIGGILHQEVKDASGITHHIYSRNYSKLLSKQPNVVSIEEDMGTRGVIDIDYGLEYSKPTYIVDAIHWKNIHNYLTNEINNFLGNQSFNCEKFVEPNTFTIYIEPAKDQDEAVRYTKIINLVMSHIKSHPIYAFHKPILKQVEPGITPHKKITIKEDDKLTPYEIGDAVDFGLAYAQAQSLANWIKENSAGRTQTNIFSAYSIDNKYTLSAMKCGFHIYYLPDEDILEATTLLPDALVISEKPILFTDKEYLIPWDSCEYAWDVPELAIGILTGKE